MSDTKLRIRIADAEVEVNGRVGHLRAVSFEGTFDQGTPGVLADIFELFMPDRAELKHLRAHTTALQAAGTSLVEERRALKAKYQDLADQFPVAVGKAFTAGRAHEREELRRGLVRTNESAAAPAVRAKRQKARR